MLVQGRLMNLASSETFSQRCSQVNHPLPRASAKASHRISMLTLKGKRLPKMLMLKGKRLPLAIADGSATRNSARISKPTCASTASQRLVRFTRACCVATLTTISRSSSADPLPMPSSAIRMCSKASIST